MDGTNIVGKYLVSCCCGLCFMKKNHFKKKDGKFECNQMKHNQPIMTVEFFLVK